MELLAIVSIILSVVAIIMAAPTIFHLFWGQPSLKVAFGQKEYWWGKALVSKLYNREIRNKLWRKLVQQAPLQDPVVWFSIEEANSRRVLTSEIEPEIRLSSGAVTTFVNLPAHPVGFRQFSIVVWNTEKEGVFSAEEKPVRLERGEYTAVIEVNNERWCQRFVVGERESDLRWKER